MIGFINLTLAGNKKVTVNIDHIVGFNENPVDSSASTLMMGTGIYMEVLESTQEIEKVLRVWGVKSNAWIKSRRAELDNKA